MLLKRFNSFVIVIVIISIFISFCPRSVLASDNLSLNPDIVVDLILENNYGLKQAEKVRDEVGESVPQAKSVFDTYLEMSGGYQLDKSKKASSFFGTRKDTYNWGLSLSKEIPSGTVLGVSFANTRSKTIGASMGGASIVTPTPQYEPVLGFSISQPFMKNSLGMNDRAQIEQAKLAYDSADFTLNREMDLSVYAGLMQYWSLVFVRKHISAQRRAVRFAREFLNTTREEKKLGTAEETDLLAARANLLGRQDELLELQELERSTAEEFRTMLAVEPDVKLNVRMSNPSFVNVGRFSDERIAAALEHRGDYRSLKKNLDRLNVKLKVAKNTRWPKLDLVSTLELNDISGSYTRSLGGMDSPNVTVGLAFSVPLENRYARADAKKSKSEKIRNVYAMKDLETQIVNKLSRLTKEVYSRKRIVTIGQSRDAIQREKLNAELQKYQQGRSSSYVIVQYQNDSVAAERSLVESWLSFQKAVLELQLEEAQIRD